MKYDVLTQPWIAVQTLSGTSENVGMMRFFENAHSYKEIVYDSPLEVYAVQRMLIAFLMDAYSLERSRDRKNLLQSGRFDMQIIEKYIEKCRTEGVTFDLFDEKRPFMQAAFDPELDEGKIKPAANLFHSVPHGNNHIHFDHLVESEHTYSADKCFRGLLAAQLFAVHMTQDYPSSVNDTPCYYVLIDGSNLFERMVLNMLSKAECTSMVWNDPPVAWRDTSKIVPKSEYADVSVLSGMTWQPRRVTFIPDNDGTVHDVYWQQGRSFHPNGRWKDPHVSFKIGKKGAYTLKPEAGRDLWRDVGAFVLSQDDKDCVPATVIKSMANIYPSDGIAVLLFYGVKTSNAKIEGWNSDSLNIPIEVMQSWEKGDRLRNDMLFIEEVAKEVHKTVKEFATAQRTKHDSSGWADNAKAEYFAVMYTFIFSDYMSLLSDSDTSIPGWQKSAVESLTEAAVSAADEIVDEYDRRFGNAARSLQVQSKSKIRYKKAMAKLRKGRDTV